MRAHRAGRLAVAGLAVLVVAGCSSGGSKSGSAGNTSPRGTTTAPTSLQNAESARASQSAAASEPAELGKPFALGTLTITISNPRVSGDDGGPWVTVDATVANHGTANSTGFNVGIVCAGQSQSGGTQAGSTLPLSEGFPASSVDHGTLNLLSSGDTRTGQRAPVCGIPAAVQVEPLDFAADGSALAPVRLALPPSIVSALNAARH